MTDPVLSLRVWSYYLLGVGAGLLLIPNQVFDILGIANTSEVWVRVVGLVAIALGVVYFAGAQGNDLGVVRSSVAARAIAVIAFVVRAPEKEGNTHNTDEKEREIGNDVAEVREPQ